MSKSQYRILEALADAEILAVQSPSLIALNLDLSRQHVSRSLAELVERDLVEKVDTGKYRITQAGRAEVTGRNVAESVLPHLCPCLPAGAVVAGITRLSGDRRSRVQTDSPVRPSTRILVTRFTP